MKKEDKALIIDKIADTLRQYSGFYLVETAGLDAEKTSALRRACFDATWVMHPQSSSKTL